MKTAFTAFLLALSLTSIANATEVASLTQNSPLVVCVTDGCTDSVGSQRR